MATRTVLFLCTGNSARSQMAEGLMNYFLGGTWQAYSAGTHPTGYVNPLVVQVMGELGIDISTQRSKSTERFRDTPFDLVVTVCDNAADNCPLWLGRGRVIHIGFLDPAAVTGTEEERLAAFRGVRDAIARHIIPALDDQVAMARA